MVDAQLPYSLAEFLHWKGFDTLHTDDLLLKEKTPDDAIRMLAVEENRIVISKDSAFLDSHLLTGIPPKLLMVTTGNIVNRRLLELFARNISEICLHFQHYNLVELDNFSIIVFE